MHHFLFANLISFLFIFPLSLTSALSSNIDNTFFSSQLERGLNEKRYDLIKELFTKESFKRFNKDYLDFTEKYKGSKWKINSFTNHQNIRLFSALHREKKTV